jgi:hypothetical protein
MKSTAAMAITATRAAAHQPVLDPPRRTSTVREGSLVTVVRSYSSDIWRLQALLCPQNVSVGGRFLR